jgi:SWI/SNF-related matrix-associated actin-dependent regulator of chromatin subfamily A member 5
VEDESLPTLGEHLITVSGKMMVLDQILKKAEKKSQVLIFS